MVVILSDLSATFTIDPSLDNDVYNICEMPYFPPEDSSRGKKVMEELTSFYYDRLYDAVNSGYSIIYINFNPLTGQVLEHLRSISGFPNAGEWSILSFYHGNEELLETKIQVTDVEFLDTNVLLDMKKKYLEGVAKYPFIKNFEIPFGFEITFEYLKKLIANL